MKKWLILTIFLTLFSFGKEVKLIEKSEKINDIEYIVKIRVINNKISYVDFDKLINDQRFSTINIDFRKIKNEISEQIRKDNDFSKTEDIKKFDETLYNMFIKILEDNDFLKIENKIENKA